MVSKKIIKYYELKFIEKSKKNEFLFFYLSLYYKYEMMEGYDADTETVSIGQAFRIKPKRRWWDRIKCKLEVLCCCKSKCIMNENNISVNSNNHERTERRKTL